MLVTVVGAKQFEVLREVVGKNAVVAVLVNPTHPMAIDMRNTPSEFGEVLVSNARSDSEFEGAFRELVQRQAGGLVIENEPFFLTVD